MLGENIKKTAYGLLNPFIAFIAKTGATPNIISTIGFVVTIGASIILVIGAELGSRSDYRYIGWFGVVLLFAGVFDMLDGQLARRTGMSTVFGALYDSVLDRYSEMVMFFGISYYLISHDYFLSSIFAFFAMIGSIMVSYVRARAESLNVDCSIGLMQRPERILLIGITAILYSAVSSVFGEFQIVMGVFSSINIENISIFTFPIFILAILANFTALQRLSHCYQKMKLP